MGLVPDSENEALIHQLLAERAQLQARIADLTVEIECASQYQPINTVRLTRPAPWGLPWTS